MKRVAESEIQNEFERQYAWGDDERHYYNPNRRKASVMGYFLRLNTVLEMVRTYAPKGPGNGVSRIADMASAQGNFGLLLAEEGYDVTAVDIKEEFLAYAKKKYTGGKFSCVQANLMEFRSNEPFDCVIMGEVIEHVAYPDQLLKAAWENLKPGGILVLSTPNGDEFGQPLPTYSQVSDLSTLIPRQFHWGDHLFLYTEAELTQLLVAQGFEVKTIRKINSCFVSQIKGARYIMPQAFLHWLENRSRSWKKNGKDSTCNMVAVARKPW